MGTYMIEFVEGTDKQYDILLESLSDNLCHVYTCTLPKSFSVANCRLGFEKEKRSNGYILYMDLGISCSISGDPLLKELLTEGILRFMDFSDLKLFLRSLTYLYQEQNI